MKLTSEDILCMFKFNSWPQSEELTDTTGNVPPLFHCFDEYSITHASSFSPILTPC